MAFLCWFYFVFLVSFVFFIHGYFSKFFLCSMQKDQSPFFCGRDFGKSFGPLPSVLVSFGGVLLRIEHVLEFDFRFPSVLCGPGFVVSQKGTNGCNDLKALTRKGLMHQKGPPKICQT